MRSEGERTMLSELLKSIRLDIEKIDTPRRAAAISKIANRYYKFLPSSNTEMLEICEELIKSSYSEFSVATLWFRKRKSLIDIKHFAEIERWLYEYIDGWGRCDQFCYRILNPFVYKYPNLYTNILKWIRSDKIYVRRAGPVSLISISGNPRVQYDIEKILHVVRSLMDDTHIHIQKAIGWLLKYAYITYPPEIIDFLKCHVAEMSRTTFRYALSKVPEEIRDEMMRV